MSRELLNVNETNTIKEGDDSTTIILSAHDNNEPAVFKAGDIGTIKISTEDVQVPSIPAKLIIGSNNVNINSKDLATLPAGQYQLELWVSQKDGPQHTIYPSDGALSLTIDKSADDLTGKKLTTLTLDDLRQDLHKDIEDAVKQIKVDPSGLDLSGYAKKSDLPKVPEIKLDTIKRTLNIDGQEISIPEAVDLSGYAKTSDVPDVKYNAETKTLTVNGSVVQIPANIDLSNYYTKEQVNEQIKSANPTIDLSDYVTHEDLTDYAKKSDIPATPDLTAYAKKTDLPTVPEITLDTQARTLTLNGQSINIPNTVDLSGYATKSELPHITLDVAKRQITVGDATIEVPGSVDLSGYYTKAEVDSKLANAAAGGKVDLSGYVKETELADYAKKSDIPAAPDLTPYTKEAELSDYAKKSDLPTMPDLAPYAKSSDVAENYESKSDASVALADKVSTSALASYATKDELNAKADAASVPAVSVDVEKRTITVNGQNIMVPESVDLSGYATKGEIPQVVYNAGSKTLTVNGQKVEIPENIDLSGYVKESELSDYAKKADVPAAPDLSGYLTSSNAATIYETKTDARRDYVTRLTLGQELTKKTEETNSLSQSVTASLAIKADKAELASYETKSEASQALGLKADAASVPSVTLDTASRKLTVNSNSITIPSEGGSDQSSDALLSQVGQFANFRMQSPFNIPVVSVDYMRNFLGDGTYRTSNSTVELDADALTYSLKPKDGATVSATSGALPPAIYQISTMGDQQGVTVKMNGNTASDASALIVIPGLTLVVAGQSLWANLTTSRFVGGSSDWPASWHKLF